MVRLAALLGLLVLLAGVSGCSTDDARQAVSNARTSVADQTGIGQDTTATRTTTTRTIAPPPETVTQTEIAPAQTVTRTQTQTQTKTVVRQSDNGSDDTVTLVVIAAAAALLAAAVLAGLWRLVRPETEAWRAQRQRASETARWAAEDLTAALLDPSAAEGERLRRWRASQTVVDDAARRLNDLSTQARHRRNGAAALELGDALAALADALDAHARSPANEGVGLVRQRAEAVRALTVTE